MSSVGERETLGFQAEITQLLDIMIHSLYSNKEIFLRELISNASDAIDRLRFAALSDEALYEGDTEYQIHVRYDKKARTITIADNGIGMTRDAVIEQIGTIARSGTREFLKSLSGDQQRDAHLIGQFGVGFYSAFVVAERVTLVTRYAGQPAEAGVRWESEGKGNYTIETVEKAARGTTVTLHLREGEDDLLSGQRLREIVRKYSDHIVVPILMPKEGQDATGDEQVNRASALWTRPRSEITSEEYTEFYRNITHDFDEPLLTIHSRLEGTLDFTLLLFIPTEAPFDLWQRERRHGVKLYVRRVFILDDAEKLMPGYLRFVRGIVDSNDLPLNVSRELLQQNRMIDQMRNAAVKKVLGALKDLMNAEDETDRAKYATFWKAFGRAFKEGLAEDPANRETIAPLLRFASTTSGGEQTVTLDDYIARLRPGQKEIFVLTAENDLSAAESPLLEIFRQKGVEVLLLTDPIDYLIESTLTEYQSYPIQSIARGAVDLAAIPTAEGQEPAAGEATDEAEADVLQRLKATLGDAVKDVRSSSRLTTSPACLVNDESDLDPTLIRLLKATGQQMPNTKPILEVNLHHMLLKRVAAETDEQRFSDWAQLLYEQSILSRGEQLDHPARFVSRLNTLLVND